MAKFGIALGSGPRGLGFESRHSDQINKRPWVWSLVFCYEAESNPSPLLLQCHGQRSAPTCDGRLIALPDTFKLFGNYKSCEVLSDMI